MLPGIDLQTFVGKDLTDTSHEVQFYLKLQRARDQREEWKAFANSSVTCGGVASLPCLTADVLEKRRLILLEDLRAGFHTCRLVDIKIGAKTCVAGWKGRTWLDSLKKAPIDSMTNSSIEGFRCEGMDNPPTKFRDYVNALAKQSKAGSWLGSQDLFSVERLSRLTMQKLRGYRMMEALFDYTDIKSGGEMRSHIVVWKVLEELNDVTKVVVKLPPQMWIGSSLAICVEVGKTTGVSPKVLVKLFDWGRSEITLEAEHAALDPATRRSRFHYWCSYVQALCRLQWVMFRQVAHRCCTSKWTAFVFELRNIQGALMTSKSSKSDMATQVAAFYRGQPSGEKNDRLALPMLRSSRHASRDGDAKRPCMLLMNSGFSMASGEGSSVFGPLQIEDIPKWELAAAKIRAFVLHVVAFELASDARRHVDAWREGNPAPKPNGRAFVRHTAPARVVREMLVWEDSIEFLGLGDSGADLAQRRLHSMWPRPQGEGLEAFGDGDPADCMEFLPAAVGSSQEQVVEASSFCNLIAPWVSDGLAFPDDTG